MRLACARVLVTKAVASGWWTLKRHQIETSPCKILGFVLAGFVNKTTDFILIDPRKLLGRLDGIHRGKPDKFQCYFCVTNGNRCWNTRGKKKADVRLMAEATFNDAARDLTTYLNNWNPIEVLNGQ